MPAKATQTLYVLPDGGMASAHSDRVGEVPLVDGTPCAQGDGHTFYSANIRLLRLHIHRLHGWMRGLTDPPYEVLFEFGGQSRHPEVADHLSLKAEKVTPARVFSYTEVQPGDELPLGANAGFGGFLFHNNLRLHWKLTETDDSFRAVGDLLSGGDLADLVGSSPLQLSMPLPYLNLISAITRQLGRVIELNKDEYWWKDGGVLAADPGPGGNYARTGVYVVCETDLQADQISELHYDAEGNHRITRRDTELEANYLVFGVDIHPARDEMLTGIEDARG